jgi:hypothetical protein
MSWCDGCISGGHAEHAAHCESGPVKTRARMESLARQQAIQATRQADAQEAMARAQTDSVRSARHHDIVCLVLKSLLQHVPGDEATAQTRVIAATLAARLSADQLYPEAK